MKIVVINGSPKGDKSNTLKLTQAFCSGIIQETEASIEILSVNTLNIHDCIGCFSCWNKTPGVCCIKDDMTFIIQKILEADIIVWSFPLYYYSLPSRLKALIDRQLPTILPFMSTDSKSGGHPARYDITGKQYVIISTCGFYTPEGNYNAVNEQFDRIYGKNGYTSLYCGEGELFRVPELQKRTDEYLKYVQSAGREFAHGGITVQTKELLSELLYPREVFEQMADADWGIQAPSRNEKTVQQTTDASLQFIKQMASLYNKTSWNGKDQIVEMYFTDIDKTYQIHLQQHGQSVLTEDFLPYTTRIETPYPVWKKIGSGELNGQQVLMEHLYTVKGNFDMMIHWDDYFGYKSVNRNQNDSGKEKSTNMTLMLVPWIVIWVALSIDPIIGGICGILVSAVIPFAFLHWKATVFEYITIFTVTAVSLLSVLGYPAVAIVPVSYFIFGLVWSITGFFKIPLTAYYSMNDYNGEQAWQNPLFIKTNRILTMCWGILYLITPIWTYFLLISPVAYLTGAINSVLPALLGIFTNWFQKWYPAYFARHT